MVLKCGRSWVRAMVRSNKDYKVSILVSSVVDRGLEPWSGLTKTIKLASLASLKCGRSWVRAMVRSNKDYKVSILTSSVVDRGLEPWSGLTKTIKLASLPQVW